MRIAHCISGLDRGGAERFLQRLVKTWPRKTDTHEILAFNGGELVEELRNSGLRVTVLNQGTSPLERLKGIYFLWQVLRSRHYDVATSSLWFSNQVMRLLTLFTRVPLLVVLHNRYEMVGWFRRGIDRVTSFLGLYARNIAVSKTVAASYQASWFAPRVSHVIPNGIDCESIAAGPGQSGPLRKHLSISKKAYVIGAVGRLVPLKGYAELIKAFAALTSRGLFAKHTPQLVIVGSGPERKALDDLIHSLKVGRSVHIVSTDEDIRAFYSEFNVYVAPSSTEGLSLAFLEAAAAQLPIITTRAAASDFLAHNIQAVVVERGSASLLEHALEDIMSDSKRWATLGIKNRDLVKKFYPWSKTVRDYAQIMAAATDTKKRKWRPRVVRPHRGRRR